MTTAITIGLSMSSRAQPDWTTDLARIDGVLPSMHFDAPEQRFALDEGTGLQPLSATQLATRITSVCAAQYIEDGIGQGVGHNIAVAANGLPLSLSGLQAHPTITRLHGQYPANGTDNAALSAPLPAEGIFEPYRIVSQGADWNRRQSFPFSTVSGLAISFACLVRPGTSGRLRIGFRNSDAGTESRLVGPLATLGVGLSTFGTIALTSNAALPNGDRFVAGTLVPNATVNGNVQFYTGPDSNVAGENVDILGAQVTDTPYPYTDWIMSGAGAKTLDASRNTLAFADGAFAFAAEIDLRSWLPGTSARVIEWNDGSVDNWSSLTIGPTGYIGLAWKSAGVYQASSNAGVTGAGIVRVYGISSNAFFRFGAVGLGDGPKQAGYAMPVGLDVLALDGVGYDLATARAYKYLRRLDVWPVSAGSDDIFEQAKAVAQGWA